MAEATQRQKPVASHVIIPVGHSRIYTITPQGQDDAEESPPQQSTPGSIVRASKVVKQLPAKILHWGIEIFKTANYDIVIAVVGPRDSEKSALIKCVTDRCVTEAAGGMRVMDPPGSVKFWDEKSKQCVVLVNVPCPDGVSQSDLDTLRERLDSSYNKEKLLSGILCLHRTTNDYAADISPQSNPIQKLCGRDATHKVYLTTMDGVGSNIGESWPAELEGYWATMTARGVNVFHCRSDDDSPKQLVQRIIHSECSATTEPSGGNVPPGPPISDSSKQSSSQLPEKHDGRLKRARRGPFKNRRGSPSQPQSMVLQTQTLVDGDSARPQSQFVDIHTLNTPFNIVIFGEAGVGKSSVINLIAGKDVAATSSDAWGCTLESKLYTFEAQKITFNIWDTIGLGEPILSVSNCLGAIEKTYALIKQIEAHGGLDLLLFCMPGSRVTTTMQSNYRLFFEVLCAKRIPIAAVVTRLEDEEEMEEWWDRNEKYLVQNGLHFGGHVCITGLRGHPKAKEGRSALESMLQDYDRKGRYPMPPASDWFSDFLRRLPGIPRSKELKQKDLERSLQQRCLMNKADAQKLAETLAHPHKDGRPRQGEACQPEPVGIIPTNANAQKPAETLTHPQAGGWASQNQL